MDEFSDEQAVVFRSRRRDQCMELRLVLESAGIASQAVHQSREWLLLVAASDEGTALNEFAAYRLDNPIAAAKSVSRIPLFRGAAIGSFLYAAIIGLIGAVSNQPESQPVWHAIGQTNAGQILSGQLWRTLTALTLHADAVHLFSNIGFGCVFGYLAGRILGGGVAWLTIVLAGALGNFLNALMRSAEHTSIGASTAVFAALGVMVAHALHPRFQTQERLLKRWSPLIAGVLLLAFIGVGGERTDVGAHVTGFLAGIVLGWIAARLPLHWLDSDRFQMTLGVLAVLLVAGSWMAAIA
ncbi:MAG: rhomboid family intramembrane serine protease [Pirellulaceae bacterium]